MSLRAQARSVLQRAGVAQSRNVLTHSTTCGSDEMESRLRYTTAADVRGGNFCCCGGVDMLVLLWIELLERK